MNLLMKLPNKKSSIFAMNFVCIAVLSLTILTAVIAAEKIPETKRLKLIKSVPSWTKKNNAYASRGESVRPNDEKLAELTFYSLKMNLIRRNEFTDKTHSMKYIQKMFQKRPYNPRISEYAESSNYNMDKVCRSLTSAYDFFGFHGIFPKKISTETNPPVGEDGASTSEQTPSPLPEVITYSVKRVVPRIYAVEKKYSHSVLNCPCEYHAEADCSEKYQGSNICVNGKFYVSNGISTLHKKTRNVNSIFVFTQAKNPTEIIVTAYLHRPSPN